MNEKRELATLRELRKIYQNCPERAAAYVRRRWISTGIAWVLISAAFLLSSSKTLNPMICLGMAFLAGIALGLAVLFATSSKQIPLMVRYLDLREEDIQKRLQELGDA